ncbi:MAG: FprA family A-type flavoprotein [Clostridia bacterium]|nr:FprA family A-type flavoprotein [Clostridia bacterium]
MYCVRKITEDIYSVGGSDRRLSLFENMYPIPNGVTYNAYFIDDEKTAVVDTVDKAVGDLFFENVEHLLGGRALDYVVVNHMEPDHCATLGALCEKHPETKIICSAKAAGLIAQFFKTDLQDRIEQKKEGETLELGLHALTFYAAPMVHWPEVTVAYEKTSGILFSADAFGTFGATDGCLFADEADFGEAEYAEARRYYANIVGKYGAQTTALLKKAAGLDIKMLCPLHGPVWRKDFEKFIEKYQLWGAYAPEEQGVLIAYGSVYGGTQNAAEILASKLAEKGVKVKLYDVAVTHPSYLVAEAFRFSHIVFASSTYNNGIFTPMETLLLDLKAHMLKNRTVALVQNGSWAPQSGKLMREILDGMQNITVLEETVNLRSTVKENNLSEIDALCDALCATM